LFIGSFIYSEINAFGLPKFSKISFAFNIFVPIPVQEMVYLMATQKNHPNGHFCAGKHRSKNVSEKNLGGLSPFSLPWIHLRPSKIKLPGCGGSTLQSEYHEIPILSLRCIVNPRIRLGFTVPSLTHSTTNMEKYIFIQEKTGNICRYHADLPHLKAPQSATLQSTFGRSLKVGRFSR